MSENEKPEGGVTMVLLPVSLTHSADELRKTAAAGPTDTAIKNDKGLRIGTMTRMWFDEERQALMGSGVVDESVPRPSGTLALQEAVGRSVSGLIEAYRISPLALIDPHLHMFATFTIQNGDSKGDFVKRAADAFDTQMRIHNTMKGKAGPESDEPKGGWVQ